MPIVRRRFILDGNEHEVPCLGYGVTATFVHSALQIYMTPETRQVLAVLTDDLAAHILRRCGQRPRSRDELVKSSSAGRATVETKLKLLVSHGLLERELDRDAERGRPPARWQRLRQHDVAAFERTADAFVHALLHGRADDQKAAIAARRAEDMQLSASDAPDRDDASA